MAGFDYVILGAGAAGCVLANRLSENPNNEVLLVEAGERSRSPIFAVPKLGSAVFFDQRYAWNYPTQPFGPKQGAEIWTRGKLVGGSTAINGMVYNRGTKPDYDELERLGNKGWGWDEIVAAYKAFEDNPFGPSPTRGVGGPLHLSVTADPDPMCEYIIEAGVGLGLRRVEDVNESDDERIGLSMANIHRGVRVTAAKAFLYPVMKRPNLHLATETTVDRLIFSNGRAVGASVRSEGNVSEVRARREVIVALGALNSPKLLQLSGIGPRDVLESAGVPIYLERDNVGRRMLEHFCVINTYRLRENLGYNRHWQSTVTKAKTTLKYLATRKGVLATPTGEVLGIFKSRPDADRVDSQVLVSMMSIAAGTVRPDRPGGIDPLPGVSCMSEVLRPTSQGSVWITSADPDAPIAVDPNYLDTEYDRRTSVDLLRKLRELFATSPLADRIEGELLPGPDVQTDDEIVDAVLTNGTTGSHTINTCGMGPSDDDIVDDRMRVRGVDGLRIVDCSIMPSMISGNLNGPMMAMAWRAADLILDSRPA
jgi:choline dehydrogenase